MKRPRESKSKQQVLEDEDVMEVESESEDVRSDSEDSNEYPKGSYFNLASSSEEEQIEVKRPKRSQSCPSSSKVQPKKAEIQSDSGKGSSEEEEGSSAEDEDNDSSASQSLDEEEEDSDDNNGKRSRKQTPKNVSSQNKSNQKGRSRAAHAISHAEFEKDEKTRLQTLFKHRETLKPFISKKVYEKITSSKPNTFVGLIEEDDDDNFQTLNKQPNTIVSCTLRGYQLEGVNWMINNYENRLNCILADEMGLGKTLQTITFLSYLLHVKKISGPMLVIVPLTVLFNWQNEIHKWCPQMQVFRIHCTDPQEHILLRSRMNKTEDYDVIITTYEMVTLSGLANAFRSIVWRCVVLDEGHRIKNEKTDAAMACHKLHAQFKLLLTGTPLQNSLYELGSLLSFLVPTVFTDLTIFTDGFELSSKRSVSINRQLLDKAHYLLRIFQLRRLKSEVEQNLPQKLETKIECPMSDLQKEITQFLLFQERKLLEKISKRLAAQKAKDGLSSSAAPSVEDEKVSDNGENAIKEGSDAHEEEEVTFTRSERASVIGLLAHLRKAANHPFLFPGIELPEFDGRAREDIITSSGKMMILDQLLQKLKEKNHRVVLFSQFTKSLDIVCDYLDYRGYPWGRLDGGTNRVMREVQINLFNRAESDLFVFCITTRAGGMGVNLCSADTVILFDSDWNPQVDIQAMARVHRIGQTKPVHVYRLVTKNTVEERIVERAQKKLFLDSMVNRGSTSNALAMDKMLLESKQKKALLKKENGLQEPIEGPRENRLKRGIEEVEEDLKESADAESEAVAVTGDGEDDEDGMLNPFISKVSKEGEIDEDDSGKIFSLLKFGWNSVFSVNEDATLSSADREKSLYLPNDVIEKIIDRSRGNNDDLGAAPSKAISNSSSNDNNVQLKENQEFSVHGFDESAPLVSVDNLRQKAMLDLEKEILLEQQLNTSGDKFKLPANELTRSKTDSSALPSKRIRKSRLEEVHVTGVGAVSVLKENNPIYMENYDSSNFSAKKKADILEGFIRRRQKKLNKDHSDEDKQQIYIPLKSGKQMAGRDYLHQDFCQVCWDGGELIVCEGCPCSYHLECLGLKKVPEKRFRWYCPHHQCVDCKKRHSVVGFLFRCEVCFQAYCEDCLPNESRLIGECKRFTEQGFRWPSNACYIRCCRDCIKFPMDKYLKMFKEQDEGMHAETIAGGRSVHDEEEAEEEEEEEEENDDQPSKKSKRKDRKKATPKKESSSKKSREKKNSSSTVSSKAAKNNNALTPSTSISSTSNSSSLINKAKAFESLDYCVLPDIKYRLFRDDNPIYRSRFQSLFEIPNFLMRFEKANDVIKHLLIHIIQYIYYENMKTSWDEYYLQEHKEQIKEEIDQIEHHKNKGSPGASAKSSSLISPNKKNSKQEAIERKDYHQDYYELFQLFSGVSMEHSNYFKLKMFLAVVNILSGVEKYYIPKMGEILGISEMQIRYENIRYSFPHIEKKSKLEEAIAALLVIPSPHNLIILAPKGTTTPPPAIIYPQDIYSYTEVEKVKDSYFLHFDNDYTQIANGIYLAVRYLQALHYPNYDIDSNRHFFTFYLETQGDLIGLFSNISLNTTPHHIYYKHIIKFWSYFLLLQPFFRTYNQVLEAKQKKGESEDDAVEIVWKKVLLENSTEDKDLKSKFKLSYAFPILYEIWKKFIFPPWQKIEEIMNMKRKTGSTVKLRKKDSLDLNEESNANEVELNDDFYDASGHLKNVKDIVFEALQKRREVLEKAFEEEIQRQIKQKEEEKKRKEAIFAANALAYQKMQEEKQQKEQLQKEQEQFQLQQKQQLLQQLQQQQQLQLQQQQLQQYRQYQEAQKQKQQQVNALQMHLKEQFQKLQQKSQPLVPNNFIPQNTAAVNPSSAYQTPPLQQLQQQYQYLLQQQQRQTQQIAQRQILAAQLMGLLPGMSQINQPSSHAAMNPALPTVASIMSDEPINLPPNSLPAVTASMLPPGEAAKAQTENHSSPPSSSPPSSSMMDLGEYYFPESNISSILPSSSTSSSGDNSYPKLVHSLQQQLTENQKRLEESMKILKFLETEEKRLQNERLLKETVKKSQTKSQKKASTSSTTSSSSSAKATPKNNAVMAPMNPPVTAATVPPPVTASLIPSTAKPSLKVASPPPVVAASKAVVPPVSQPQQVPPPASVLPLALSLSDPAKKEATATKTSPGLYFDSSEKFSDGLKRNTPAPTVSAANIPASSSLATKLMKGYQINQANPPVVSSSSPPATEKEDTTTTSPGLYFDSSEKFSDGLKRNTPAPTVTTANIPASSSLATKLMKGYKIDQTSAKTASTTSSTSSGPITKASSDVPSVEKPQTSQKSRSKASSSSTSVMKQEAAKQVVELKATATEPVKEAKTKANESSKPKKKKGDEKSIFIDLSL